MAERNFAAEQDSAYQPLINSSKIPLALRGNLWMISDPLIMAKTSWLERDKRKRNTVEKYAELRAELKARGDYIGLSHLPENFVYNAGGGVVFRRLTTTFLSPLTTAYLLVVALFFVFTDRR